MISLRDSGLADLLLSLGHTGVELINTSCGVDDLLLAGVMRVALTADFDLEFWEGTIADCIRSTTAASDLRCVGLWVSVLLHVSGEKKPRLSGV